MMVPQALGLRHTEDRLSIALDPSVLPNYQNHFVQFIKLGVHFSRFDSDFDRLGPLAVALKLSYITTIPGVQLSHANPPEIKLMILSALNIEPLVSVGPFAFNMTRQSVREVCGPGFRSFRRTEEGQIIDLYENALFFYFDERDRLEAIEMTLPASPTYRGTALLKFSFGAALTYLRTFDPMVIVEKRRCLGPVTGN